MYRVCCWRMFYLNATHHVQIMNSFNNEPYLEKLPWCPSRIALGSRILMLRLQILPSHSWLFVELLEFFYLVPYFSSESALDIDYCLMYEIILPPNLVESWGFPGAAWKRIWITSGYLCQVTKMLLIMPPWKAEVWVLKVLNSKECWRVWWSPVSTFQKSLHGSRYSSLLVLQLSHRLRPIPRSQSNQTKILKNHLVVSGPRKFLCH